MVNGHGNSYTSICLRITVSVQLPFVFEFLFCYENIWFAIFI